MDKSRRTAAGTFCPSEVWKTYIKNLLDKENAKDVLKRVLAKNSNNQDAIKELKEILLHRPDLLDYINKISVLL